MAKRQKGARRRKRAKPPRPSHEQRRTQPPPDGRGSALIVSADGELVQRVAGALREAGWTAIAVSTLVAFEGGSYGDVVVFDPRDDGPVVEVALHVIARLHRRPAVVLALRSPADLGLAVRFGVGCVAADALDEVFVEVVKRAKRHLRAPRLLRPAGADRARSRRSS